MSSKARQIAEHFRIHGTPIMIGKSYHYYLNAVSYFDVELYVFNLKEEVS